MSDAKTLEQRVTTLEASVCPLVSVHKRGGDCDDQRGGFWTEINKLKARMAAQEKEVGERLAKLETRLVVWGSIAAIAGPILAQLFLKWLTK